ncbi:MAG: hypothetical protein JWP37_538 [Mucilaginibacter sp.]|nr:hypothetical protein [Mucilaginibacter sp.]
MASDKIKIIHPQKEKVEHTHSDNWELMKPFVRFSFKAIKVIALGLIAIVKALPTLKPQKDTNTSLKRR